MMFGVKKMNVKKTPEAFLRGFDQLLTIEGIEIDKIDKIFQGYEEYEFTKTTSKVSLGNMNDLVALYKHSILHEGGFKHIDIGKLIMKINRTPPKKFGLSSSIELVKELLGEKQKMPHNNGG